MSPGDPHPSPPSGYWGEPGGAGKMAGGISPAPRLVRIPRRLLESGRGHPLSPAVGGFGDPRPPEGDTSHCGGLGWAQDPSPAARPAPAGCYVVWCGG